MVITINRAPHACLFQRYDLKAGDFVNLGVKGTYGQVDPNSGAEYKCLGLGKKGNKISYPSDCKVGYFYSENTFIWGEDDNGKPLSFEDVENFITKTYGGKEYLARAILPNGWNKGLTWYNSIYFSPVERQPYSVESLVGYIKQRLPQIEIISKYNNAAELYIPE